MSSMTGEVLPIQRVRPTAVRIEPWGAGDLPLLEKLLGDPAMMEHLGGPESPQKIAERQARYERMKDGEKGRVFKIIMEPDGEAVGWVGYLDKTWRGQAIYGSGWCRPPSRPSRGMAKKRRGPAVPRARAEGW